MTERRASGPGYSIRAAAMETGLPAKRIQRAIELGEIRVIELGSTKRIPQSEVDRLRGLYDEIGNADDTWTPTESDVIEFAAATLEKVAKALEELSKDIHVLRNLYIGRQQ